MKDEIMVKSGKTSTMPNSLSLIKDAKLKLKNLSNHEETLHEDYFKDESILDRTGMLPDIHQFANTSPMDILPRNHTPGPFNRDYIPTIDVRNMKPLDIDQIYSD